MIVNKINKTIKKKQNNYNGGYVSYFKLYKEFNQELKKLELKYIIKIMIRTKIILQVIFKPLLCLFHTVVNYESEFCLTDGCLTDIYSYSKETTIYFLKFIPIWYMVSNKPTDKDIDFLK